MRQAPVSRYAWLAIAAALVTIAFKLAAYLLTDSVGLLSDSAESVVNLIAAIFALVLLRVAERPPDETHSYGHEKAEYFSSGAEGTLILIASAGTLIPAVSRLINPVPLHQIGLGLLISGIASLVNLVVGQILIRVGRSNRSIALEADGHHLMSDVWTSVGVIAGVAIVGWTGITVLDPLIAIAVAANLFRTGVNLLRCSIHGLMDRSLPSEDLAIIQDILSSHMQEGVRYHALRTRQAGARSFVSFHIQVPGAWTVQRGHDLLEKVEARIRSSLPNIVVFTHLEPLEDPRSFHDQALDRSRSDAVEEPSHSP